MPEPSTSPLDLPALKSADQAALATSRRLLQMAENAHDVFWVCSPDFRQLHYVSPSYERSWGYPAAELHRDLRSFFEHVHPEDRPLVMERFGRIQRGEGDLQDEQTRELRVFVADGSLRWILSRYLVVRDPDGEPAAIVGIATDVTDRKLTALQLQASISKNEAILRAIPDLIFVNSREGVYLEFHAPRDAPLLVPRDQVLGRHFRDILPPELAQWVTEAFDGVARDGQARMLEYPLMVQGDERYYEAHTVAIDDDRILTVVRDITTRKRIENELRSARDELERRVVERTQALRESETRLLEAQRIAHLGNWTWNLETNELDCSEEVFRIFGLSPENFGATYEAFLERVHPDDRPLLELSVKRALREGHPYSLDHGIIRPDGEVRFLHQQAEVAADASGRFLRIAGTVQDITDRVQAEEQARHLQTVLAHVSRVSTMGEMATGIAHEINQPLSAIASLAHAAQTLLTEDAGAPGSQLRDILEKIESQSLRAGEIIRRLRRFVQKTVPQSSAVDLNDLIASVLAMVQAEARIAEVEFVQQLDDTLPNVVADGIQIQQVILNLVRNAMEAVGGVEPMRRKIFLFTRQRDAGEIEASVRDFGPGLSAEARQRVFDAFYTTKPQGLGMGLAISRSIVESHRGRLWVESRDGEGAGFHFTLPISVSGISR